jgi:uncharacterized protein (DUF697 family)
VDDNKNTTRKRLEHAKQEYNELGGWRAFRSGEFLWLLINKSFKNYWERATLEYFHKKYGTADPEKIAKRLISVASKNASILGAMTGAAVSADEIVGILTVGEAGMGLPANIAIAGAAVSAEAMLLVRLQIQLVANLGKLYGAPLDTDDPEDILTILAFALGGSVADAAGTAGMRIGGNVAGYAAKKVFSKEVLAFFKKVAAKVGIKLLQRTVVKYTVPIASVGIGAGWNYFATRKVGGIAINHFKQRIANRSAAANQSV